MSEYSLEKLRTTQSYKKRLIKGCPNYEILNNHFYADKFQFLSMDLRNEKLDNDFSDVITKAIYVCPHNNKCDAKVLID